MKKNRIIAIILIIALVVGLIVFIVNKNKKTIYTIKVTSSKGQTYNSVKVGDKIEGVSILEIKKDKVVIKIGKERPTECEYGKTYRLWPEGENEVTFKEPLTELVFEK